MTKTKKLFINEYKCFIDPVKHLVHNDNKTYDYMIKYTNGFKNHDIYNDKIKIGEIIQTVDKSDIKIYKCTLHNYEFVISKSYFNWDITPIKPPKITLTYNNKKYKSTKPIFKNNKYCLNFSQPLKRFLKISSSNFTIRDNDILFECIKIDKKKSKYILSYSDEIPVIVSFVLSCVNNFTLLY